MHRVDRPDDVGLHAATGSPGPDHGREFTLRLEARAGTSHDAARHAEAWASLVQELAEQAPSLPASEPVSAIMDLSLAAEEYDWVVLVDGGAHPVGLVERAALLRGEPFERRVHVAGPALSLRALAKQALGRPRADRCRPLAVCDEGGRYIGLLRMERLLEAFAA